MMAQSPTPKPIDIQTDFDRHQRDARSIRRWWPRANRSQSSYTPIDVHHKPKHEEESLTGPWDKAFSAAVVTMGLVLNPSIAQFQADRKLREERRQLNGPLPPHLRENSRPSTSYLKARKRSSHSVLSSQIPLCKDANFVGTFDADRPRPASLSYDRQLCQRYLSNPSPPSSPPNHKTQRRESPQRKSEDNLGPGYHPVPPSPTSAERFGQGRSNWSSASIQLQETSNTPIDYPRTGSTPDPSGQKLPGLTRRPRVRNPHRVSRVLGDVPSKSVDLEARRVTKMGYSVMSVRHSNPDGSGSSSSSRFVLPPAAACPIPIGSSDSGTRHLGGSPSSHVESETERPISRIKVQEGAGSAPISIYSISKEEPHTLATPSLMNRMEEEGLSLSPVSTTKAPPDQHSVIREDLQQDERPIAGCRADPRTSSRETAEAEDRDPQEFVHSTSPSLEVPHLGGHAVPAENGDGRNQPGHQSLSQELYQMLEPPVHSGPGTLRSEMRIGRDEKLEEGAICPDTPRGPGGSEQILHVDILLAQRVVRDAMQEDGECTGFSYQSCMLSASECGEEAVDSNSNWSECGLDRKHSTRSVFDWGYA